MSAAKTPWPWKVGIGRSLVGRPYYVCRDVSPRPSFTHFEQLRDENGALLCFETEVEALDTLAKAIGSAA
jgi:hypothetical protein